jgi:hypothetical protein
MANNQKFVFLTFWTLTLTYERHGFELLGTIQTNTSPSIFPMLRKPRSI